MTTKLSDTRDLTLDDARQLFDDIAQLELEIAKRQAMAEVRIAKLKAQHQAEVAAQVAARDTMKAELANYIMGHPENFKRPRSVQTDFGRFGRRQVSNVAIAGAEDLIDWALDNGYDDVVRIIRRLQKSAIAKRLRRGEDVPGASLVTGEEAFYTVDKTLIAAAKEHAAT